MITWDGQIALFKWISKTLVYKRTFCRHFTKVVCRRYRTI